MKRKPIKTVSAEPVRAHDVYTHLYNQAQHAADIRSDDARNVAGTTLDVDSRYHAMGM
jgi:hypothetical protein